MTPRAIESRAQDRAQQPIIAPPEAPVITGPEMAVITDRRDKYRIERFYHLMLGEAPKSPIWRA